MSSKIICRRFEDCGRESRTVQQRVYWSGDTIDVCSVCGMNVYQEEWEKYHSPEITIDTKTRYL